MSGSNLLSEMSARQNTTQFRQEHWQGTFSEYLDLVRANPKVARTAYQRVYDMIIADGSYKIDKDLVRYKFFDDLDNNGEDAIFGLEFPINPERVAPILRRLISPTKTRASADIAAYSASDSAIASRSSAAARSIASIASGVHSSATRSQTRSQFTFRCHSFTSDVSR